MKEHALNTPIIAQLVILRLRMRGIVAKIFPAILDLSRCMRFLHLELSFSPTFNVFYLVDAEIFENFE